MEESFENFSCPNVTFTGLIQTGKFGNVYKAYSDIRSDYIAVKVINRNTKHEQILKTAENEIKLYRYICCKYGSECMIGYYGHYKTSEYTFIFMELAVTDLFEYLQERNDKDVDIKFSEEEKYICSFQVAESVDYCRKNLIFHRDIKPDNYLIIVDEDTNSPRLKLCDFTFTLILKSFDQKVHTPAGTTDYASPELVKNLRSDPENYKNFPYDIQSDLWSLGVLLYEIWTFKQMFSAENENATELNILENIHRPFNDQIPACITEIIKGLLEIEPSERMFDIENFTKI
jgi:serine/threonine protein kinase